MFLFGTKGRDSMRYGKVLMLCVIAGAASTASAQVAWDVPNGMTDSYFYENGGSSNGLFGNPTILPDGTFLFNPTNFKAQVVGGPTSQIVDDQLFFDIIAKPGFNVTGIRITEYGDYSIVGEAEVSIGGGLIVTNLDFLATETDTLVSTPGSPISTPTPGSIWTATAGVDLSDKVPAWNRIRIQLNNILIATTFNGNSSALVEKKGVGGLVSIEIIPAPGTAGLLALGGLFATRRRR